MRRNQRTKKLTIIAEDEATYRIAKGFIDNPVACKSTSCDSLHYGKGWSDIVGMVKSLRLDVQTEDYVVLVIDYDERDTRRYDYIKAQLESLPFNERVFLLGSKLEAEKLVEPMRTWFGISDLTLDQIGFQLAQECAEGKKPSAWESEFLDINYDSIWRLERFVKPFLFK